MTKKKILFVDDESIILDVAEMFITGLGYDVLVADSGTRAIELIDKIDQLNIGLVFLDLMMPGTDGFDVLMHVKKKNIKVPIVVQSGILSDKDIRKTQILGAVNFVSKPYEMEKIEEMIEKYFQGC